MFTRIQARSYRCLKSIDQKLGRFQALVGPNASGKTTFLDVIGFLGDLQNRGDVHATIAKRSNNFEDLLWMREGHAFQLAVEAEIPKHVWEAMAEDKKRFKNVRYEIEIGYDQASNQIGLNFETLWLKIPDLTAPEKQRELFPMARSDAPDIISKSQKNQISKAQRNQKAALTKKPGGNDNYHTEGRKSYRPSFRSGPGRSALYNTPADEASFPVSIWFRSLLEQGVQSFVLNSQLIRQPSPPGLGRRFKTDGSNLPWVVADLRKDPAKFNAWLEHVRTALGDIKDVNTVERPEDKHRYLVVEYNIGLKVPSWFVSDGTLRLLALTLPAYLDIQGQTLLIDEPENGIHPRAMETVLQSLSSVYGSQVLIATHSPIALNMLEANDVLCFAKDKSGATDIVSGSEHPALRDWKAGEPDLGLLFASGILS